MGRKHDFTNYAYEQGCLGKESHETEAAAWEALRFRVRYRVVRAGDGQQPYECQFCNKWHLGHPAVTAPARVRVKGLGREITRHA